MRRYFLPFLLVGVSGCVTFHDHHHFQAVDPQTGEAVNYYRVSVDGRACFSKARYVTGYYDPLAVDLFFNEIKSTSGKEADVRPIFETDEAIKPLEGEGTLMMIFSTNAKAVADTIGQFAENQVVAEALTSLINRDEIRSLQARRIQIETADVAATAALATELDGLFSGIPQDGSLNSADAMKAFLRILNVIATGQGSTMTFADFEQARAWFQSQAAGGRR